MTRIRIRMRVSFLWVSFEEIPPSKRAIREFFTALPPGFKKVTILSPEGLPKLASERS